MDRQDHAWIGKDRQGQGESQGEERLGRHRERLAEIGKARQGEAGIGRGRQIGMETMHLNPITPCFPGFRFSLPHPKP